MPTRTSDKIRSIIKIKYLRETVVSNMNKKSNLRIFDSQILPTVSSSISVQSVLENIKKNTWFQNFHSTLYKKLKFKGFCIKQNKTHCSYFLSIQLKYIY